nr:unnamed protein product [Callosobruchus chinensis]
MRPYPRNNVTPEKAAFNYRLSRARRCVECAFGILCAKWTILTKNIETNTENARDIIKASCTGWGISNAIQFLKLQFYSS